MALIFLAGTAPAWSDETFGGLGLKVSWAKKPDGLEIYQVNPSSPAEKAGLYKYQQIRSIDGQPVEGKTSQECQKLLRGRIGSKAILAIVDPLIGVTNLITVIRAKADAIEVSMDAVLRTNKEYNANVVAYYDGTKSITHLAGARVQSNQVLWVATTNDGVAGFRFLTNYSSRNGKTNLESVTYAWNYRASPTSPLSRGTNAAKRIVVWKEVRPNREVGEFQTSFKDYKANAGPVFFDVSWGGDDIGYQVSYDASIYSVRITDLPAKVTKPFTNDNQSALEKEKLAPPIRGKNE